MVRKLLIIILLLIVYFLVKEYLSPLPNISAESTLLTGLILIAAYLFALVIKKWGFPKLTGYMLLGVIIGPVGFNYLNHDALVQLKFLESMALSFIALTAGGEFKFKTLIQNLKSLVYLLCGQIFVVFFGLLATIVLFSSFIPFLSDLDDNLLIGFAIIFAGVAISKSPATTIGIITELNAKGKVTNIVLNVTVAKSIFLVIVFPFIIFWSKFYLVEGTTFNMNLVFDLFTNILGSIRIRNGYRNNYY